MQSRSRTTVLLPLLLGGALAACAPSESADPAQKPEAPAAASRASQEVASAIDADCVGEYQGGETSCKDEATWISYATQACEAKGLALGTYAFSTDCGKGYWRYIKYECCGDAEPTPKPTPTPPPTPEPCTSDVMGSDSSCKTTAVWKYYANQACEKQGMTLVDYSPYTRCGIDRYRYVKYACCAQ